MSAERPHFRLSAVASRLFDNGAHGQPRDLTGAVSRVTAMGFLLREEDLPLMITRRIDELIAAGDWTGAAAMKQEHLAVWQDETRALRLLHARQGGTLVPLATPDRDAAEREAKRLEQREAVAELRGGEAFSEWLAAKKREFVELARQDFDREHPSHTAPSTKTRRKTA